MRRRGGREQRPRLRRRDCAGRHREAQAVDWAVEVYKPILDYAAAKGIVLGLEDDNDPTRTSAQLLTIIKRVNHPARGRARLR